MTQPTADVLLRIERLLRLGKHEEAQLLLVEYLKVNPSSARGWWLMSLTVADSRQQMDCLERVLRLDPDDELARERYEMLKNQPPPLTVVKPFTALDLSEVDVPVETPPAAPDLAAPAEAAPETEPPALAAQPTEEMPDWAAHSQAVPEVDKGVLVPEPAEVMPAWAAPHDAVPTGREQAPRPEPAPAEPSGPVPVPEEPKRRWRILDIILAILALIIIAIFVFYFLKQQQTRKQADLVITQQQQTLAAAQTLASMPLPTLPATWTPSATWSAQPRPTDFPTPTFTPTLSFPLTSTPPPSGWVAPIVGLYAPSLYLPDLATGQTIIFNQFGGPPALIFFFSSQCPLCDNGVAQVERIFQAYNDSGLELLAIDSAESTDTVKAYRSAHQLTFPILLDPSSKVLQAYRVESLPMFFFVNTAGRITYIGKGEMTPDELNAQVEAILQRPPIATP